MALFGLRFRVAARSPRRGRRANAVRAGRASVNRTDHYAVLGVAPEATAEQIRVAHHREQLRWADGVVAGDDYAVLRTGELDEALAVLSDPVRRRAHDKERAARPTTQAPASAHRVLPASYRETRLWVILAAMMVTSAVVAELVSVKLFEVKFYSFLGWDRTFTLTAGALLWPLVFLTTDTINEFYGRKAVRFVTWVTMAMIGWTFLIANLSIQIPGAVYSPVPDAPFAQVFGQSSWIIVGSMAAFFLSQIVDVTVFSWIRRALGGRHIWARSTGSTIVSQLIDSFVVIYIAFWLPTQLGLPGVDASKAMDISLSSFTYKVGVAVGLTPLIYVAHYVVERWLGHDVAHAMAHEAHAA
jgi:uncharacterized integral membrane protein (TIGR00697 family)